VRSRLDCGVAPRHASAPRIVASPTRAPEGRSPGPGPTNPPRSAASMSSTTADLAEAGEVPEAPLVAHDCSVPITSGAPAEAADQARARFRSSRQTLRSPARSCGADGWRCRCRRTPRGFTGTPAVHNCLRERVAAEPLAPWRPYIFRPRRHSPTTQWHASRSTTMPPIV
jgi:hypothetical protein